MTTPLEDVAVALPVVIAGALTTVTVTAAVVLWIGARFRDVEKALADAVTRVLTELHSVSTRVTIIETRSETRAESLSRDSGLHDLRAPAE